MPHSNLDPACQVLIHELLHLHPGLDCTRDSLLEQLREKVQEMQVVAQQNGASTQDIIDITYALVALVDEQVPLRCPALAGHWRSALQQSLFGENRAGEGFFERLDEVLRSPHRDGALRVFAWCLGLGFRGRYGCQTNAALIALKAKVQRQLELQNAPIFINMPIGPPAAAPLHRHLWFTYLWPITVAVCLLLLMFAGLRWHLNQESKALLKVLPNTLAQFDFS